MRIFFGLGRPPAHSQPSTTASDGSNFKTALELPATMPRKSAFAHLVPPPVIVHEPDPVPLPPPPGELSSEMKRWWQTENEKFEFGTHQLKLLELACGAWDRMTQARQALSKHGLTHMDDKGGIRPRPEIAIERDSRIAFARLVRELHLDNPDSKD